MNMNCWIFMFLIGVILGFSDCEKPNMEEITAKCREEHNLQIDEVANLNRTKHVQTNDERIKCYFKCILNGLNLMNEEGDLTLDDNPDRNMRFKKHFPACKDVTGTDSCDKAVNFQNCMWTQIGLDEKTSQ